MSEQTIFLPEVIIDTHCHGRDMEEKHKTTVEQVLAEAIKGLISITCLMPNTKPPITICAILEIYSGLIKQARKKRKIKHPQFIFFGLTDNNLEECKKALRRPIVIGLKAYSKYVTTGSVYVSDERIIVEAMKLAREHDKVIDFHCDDPVIIKLEGYSIRAENEYVKKILRLARQVPSVKIVICHVSCKQNVELILRAQAEGMNVVIELAPHYLWFDSNKTNWNLDLDPAFYCCYNNLRPKEHRESLYKLLDSTNELVIIGSDNAHHRKNEKLKNRKLGGIPSNQEMVPVIVTLAQQLGLTNERVAQLLSWNASKFFNIPVSKNLVEYKLEKRIDALQYNNGKVVNPWNGSELLFPIPIQN